MARICMLSLAWLAGKRKSSAIEQQLGFCLWFLLTFLCFPVTFLAFFLWFPVNFWSSLWLSGNVSGNSWVFIESTVIFLGFHWINQGFLWFHEISYVILLLFFWIWAYSIKQAAALFIAWCIGGTVAALSMNIFAHCTTNIRISIQPIRPRFHSLSS